MGHVPIFFVVSFGVIRLLFPDIAVDFTRLEVVRNSFIPLVCLLKADFFPGIAVVPGDCNFSWYLFMSHC